MQGGRGPPPIYLAAEDMDLRRLQTGACIVRRCWLGVTITGHFCYCKLCELEEQEEADWQAEQAAKASGAKMGVKK